MDRDDKIRRVLRHDVKNPLAVIVGRCELLASGAMGPMSEGQAKSVEAIARAARRIQEMVDALAQET